MLEQIALDPLVAAAAALLGVLLGLLLGRLFFPGPREVKRLQAEIERLGRDHAEYQGRVAGHFQKTGELFGQMTQSYKAVYDHLADGAQSLCAADRPSGLAFGAPRLIVDDTVTIGAEGTRPPVPGEAARADGEIATELPRHGEPVELVEPVHVMAPAHREPVEPTYVMTPADGGTPPPHDDAIKPV